MSKGIKISPKHGLNPTIPVCFWCGKNKNEIVLLGKLKDDKEAPKNVVMDYEPCEKCAEMFSRGLHVIAATTSSIEDRPPLSKVGDNFVYPTGAHIVLKFDAARELLNVVGMGDDADAIIKGGKLLMEEPVFMQFFEHLLENN